MRNAVAAGAKSRCEYCPRPTHNLAYSCNLCNWMKGGDVAAYDASSRMLRPNTPQQIAERERLASRGRYPRIE